MTALGQDLLHDLPLTSDRVYRDDRIGQIQEIQHVRDTSYLVFLFRNGEASDADALPFFLKVQLIGRLLSPFPLFADARIAFPSI